MNLPKPKPANLVCLQQNVLNSGGNLSEVHIEALQQRVREQANLQKINRNVFTILYNSINIPLNVVTVTAGATAESPINFDVPFSGNPPVHVTLTPQVLGFTSAILSGLNTVIQPSIKAEQYANAQKSYEELDTDIERFKVLFPTETSDCARDNFLNLLERAERINQTAPAPIFTQNIYM